MIAYTPLGGKTTTLKSVGHFRNDTIHTGLKGLQFYSNNSGFALDIREFTYRYNEPPGGFLRDLRLDHARTMLAATNTDVESIALSSCYASINSFRRAYRQKLECRQSSCSMISSEGA